MRIRRLFGLFAVLVMLAAAGCSTPRTVGYLNDMQYGIDYPVLPAPELKVQVGDKLNIKVLSERPELAAPFNTMMTITDLSNQSVRQPVLTYTVDSDGNIKFPVLGLLHVEGMTLKEVEQMLASEIIGRGYIRDPMISVDLDNFVVYVIGERHSMLVRSDNNAMTLFEAIIQFGGTNRESINRQEVTVVRTENGVRRAYAVDVQKLSIYDSPVYYLQQNDMIYLKHKGVSFSQQFNSIFGSIRFVTGLANLAITILAYMAIVNK